MLVLPDPGVAQHIGFGVGAEGRFRFDNLRADVPSSGGVALACEYDAMGRVVGRTTFDNNGAVASQRYYIYDNDRIVQELDGNGVTVAEWVYGSYIDEPLAMYRGEQTCYDRFTRSVNYKIVGVRPVDCFAWRFPAVAVFTFYSRSGGPLLTAPSPLGSVRETFSS